MHLRIFAENTIKMKKYFAILALAILASCSDDEKPQDTVAPTIKNVEINDGGEYPTVTAGADMTLKAEVDDNELLQELKLEIHDIFDGHSHGKMSNTWEQIMILPLSGASQSVAEVIPVPGTATAGKYHVVLRAIDAEGNESDFVEKEFILSNGNEPQITVSNPSFGQNEVHAPKGSNFDLQGTITEDTDLVEVVIMIAKADHEGHAGKRSASTIFMTDFDLTGSNETSFDLGQVDITIPTDAETGHYELSIVAKDNAGNYGLFIEEIHVM